MTVRVHFMDSCGQYEANLTQAKRNSHLPEFDRYNMAQLQTDVVAVKGIICNGGGGQAKFKVILA